MSLPIFPALLRGEIGRDFCHPPSKTSFLDTKDRSITIPIQVFYNLYNVSIVHEVAPENALQVL